MESTAEYIIDGERCVIDITGSTVFGYGLPVRLSTAESDMTAEQTWYPRGYGIYPFLGNSEFRSLQVGIEARIREIVATTGVDVSGFQFEKYHRHIRNDTAHLQVVRLTRDLFPPDFNFDLHEITQRLGNLLGFPLTDVNPETGEQLHIIVRINRPGSTDFNPPHKDIYEAWDGYHVIPKFINFWIPICGVSNRSSLPLASGSHLIPEDRIYRTKDGGVVSGRQYRVRSVLHWNGQNAMERPTVGYGEVIVFSPHLIHGCALNRQEDTTRVALEFRLYRKT